MEETTPQESSEQSLPKDLRFSKALKISDFTVNEEERTITQYISTKDEDRGNDVMIPDGVKLTNYKVNPVVLWGHNQRELPIAKALWTKVDNKGVLSKAQFAKHQFAEDAWQLVLNKFINATSIGFIPLKSEEKETGKFREVWGMQIPIVKRIVHEWELLEWSYVNIPMNPKALVQRDFSGLGIKSTEMKSFLLQEAEKYKSLQMDEELKNEFSELFKQFKEDIEGKFKSLEDSLDEKIKSSTPSIQTVIEPLQKSIAEITGEFKAIKDAEAKRKLDAITDKIVAGVISEKKGQIDYLFK